MSFRLGLGLGLIPASARPAPTGAPVNTVAPAISGILTQGQTLTALPGTWTGLPSSAFTYQWQRSGSNIGGATSETYVAQAADVSAGASAITVEVTGTNSYLGGSSTTAESAGVTIAAPLGLTGTPGAPVVGVFYTFTPTNVGGHTPKTYALTGTLPAGLSLNTSTGAITGTPTTSGTASGLDITVTDADGLTATLGTFSLVVSAPSATSDIETFEIMSDTPKLDATDDYGDSDAQVGVNGNGWVEKITLTVTDPGYDASGTTSVVRTIVGGAILRRQYDNHTSLMQANDGTTYTIYVSLSGPIYSGSAVAGEVAASYYGASADGTFSVTNSSTLAYEKPRIAFATEDNIRATADLPVEMVAFHRHPMNGQQVARIEFIAKDSQGTPNVAATQTCTAPTLSSVQTQGNICEVWKATIPLTALTQGDRCFVGAKVYPWIGDSSAILDLEVDGQSVTGGRSHACPVTRLRFLNDKTGGYGGGFAYVASGGTATTHTAGVFASAQDSTTLTNSQKFATIQLAITEMSDWNNANRSHANHSGGTIYLMDNAGADFAHTIGSSNSVAAGLCWTDIRKDPQAVGAVSITISGSVTSTEMLRFVGVPINQTGGFMRGASNPSNLSICFKDCTITQSGSPTGSYNNRFAFTYLMNVTLTTPNATYSPFGTFSADRYHTVLALGVVKDEAGSMGGITYAMLGCVMPKMALQDPAAASTQLDSPDGAIVYNSSFMKMSTVSTWSSVGSARVYATYGYTMVQVIAEPARNGGSDAQPFASISEQIAGMKLLAQYCTFPGPSTENDDGSRFNMLYSDDIGGEASIKQGVFLYNIFYHFNMKADTFLVGGVPSQGRVSNWRTRWGVDVFGNCMIQGSSFENFPAYPGSDNTFADYYPPSNNNSYPLPADWGIGDDLAMIDVTWVSNLSGTPNPGGGDYHLAGATNLAWGKVPAGFAGLNYDLDGDPRLNDGDGAAGAFERS